MGDLDKTLAGGPESMVLDLGQVESFDSAGLGAVVEGMRRARDRGVEVKLRGLSQPMLDFFSLVSVDRLTKGAGEGSQKLDPVSKVGALAMPFGEMFYGIGRTTADTMYGLFVAPFRGKRLRIDRLVIEIDQAAFGAMPIVMLIGFLLGLILAMQAYVQLRVFGAEVYMADMVAVSVTSEIGPLMTAIILAARSGSSNAAQLGSMIVGEEIDALLQMGVNPTRFLVVPKVLALAFSVVVLGIVFDLVAMIGGAMFAYLISDIAPNVFRLRAQDALHLADFALAMLKSLTFGLSIGIVGCSLGLRVKGGSEGVGRATTNAVVLSIFLIIVVDAVFVAVQRVLL